MNDLAVRPTALPDERAALIELLAGDDWPFHGRRRPTPAQAAQAIDDGLYGGAGVGDARAFWLVRAGDPVGLVTLRELDDPTPVFDLRVRSPWRGQGLGRAAVRWLAEHVFTATDKLRLEAHTRADNVAMRRVLRACGWVKEAHHRRAWPDDAGTWHDAVAYAVLKDDWLRGAATPVPFDHEP
ncbi:MAG: GNAT family N-acetyltransferase [Planctomycetes bacterium]|nr:GNAT family N-acetyltransferase [Planctomycetota bacterium]